MEERFVTAARDGDVAGVSEALRAGVDVNVRIMSGPKGTALYHAAFNNRVEIVKLLLAQPSLDVNNTDTNSSDWSALHAAALSGHTEVLVELLKYKGIDLNSQNRAGRTPLMYAVTSNRKDIVALLLQQESIEINATDDSGWDALMLAAKENKPEIAKMLLKHRDIELQSKDGKTALGIAQDRHYKKVEKIILEYSAPELRTEVGLVLKTCDLEQYAKDLFDNKVKTLAIARTLQDRDLKFMNISKVGERKRVLLALGAITDKDDVPTATIVDQKMIDDEVIAKQSNKLRKEVSITLEPEIVDDLPVAPTGTVEVLPTAPKGEAVYAKAIPE